MAAARRNQLSLSRLISSRLQTLTLELQLLSGRWAHTFAGGGEGTRHPKEAALCSASEIGHFGTSTWKALHSRAVGIDKSAISSFTWVVLKILKQKGFKAYLVGGCVRDLLLKKTPKDFDVITTANLEEVKQQFPRARVVGRRFPICQVFIKGSVTEVSSFETTHTNVKERQIVLSSQRPSNCDYKAFICWRNCMQRDFTINGLLYDPSADKVYDYVDGIRDIKALKVRTVIPAHLSFEEDCARILRGLRIAARLCLAFSKETAAAIRDLSSTIVTLDKSRLMMEMNFMLAYGAAERSICLLQRFNLLEILLPIHAVYLSLQTKKKIGQSSTMLMKLLYGADKLLAADRPSDCTLWLGLLAFHLALIDHPQDAVIVWTFSSILYYGNWKKALEFAKENGKTHVCFVPEISKSSGNKDDDSLSEGVSHFASLVKSSINALVSSDALVKSMAKYQTHSLCSGLVFVSEKMGKNVAELFDVLQTNIESFAVERKRYDIDYELLKRGDKKEIRFVLGKIIMDALESGVVQEQKQELVEAKAGRVPLHKLF